MEKGTFSKRKRNQHKQFLVRNIVYACLSTIETLLFIENITQKLRLRFDPTPIAGSQ